MIVGLDVGGTHTDVVVLEGKEIVNKVKLLPIQSSQFHFQGFNFTLLGIGGIREPV